MERARVRFLERANYDAIAGWLGAIPGCKLIVRDDVIITSAWLLPGADMNHACLLQAASGQEERLIGEIVAGFRARRRRAHVFLSPACTPPDLAERLCRRGFRRQDEREAWLVLEDLPGFRPPPATAEVEVRQVGARDAGAFARVYLAAFGMPSLLAPVVTPLLRRAIHSPQAHYYLALLDGRPAGVGIWHGNGDVACLGGTGVLPAFRGQGVGTNIGIRVVVDAKRQGVQTLLSQTVHRRLEASMCRRGFRRAFTRSHYVL
jgi:GNAT superfamily N-acetyltransferase